MADFWSNLGDGVAAIAPTIASAFGGPLAGLAVTSLEKVLGVEPGTSGTDAKGFEAKLQAAMASPEQVLALRQADIAFKQFCIENELKIEQVAAGDTADARNRQVQTKDSMPAILGTIIILAFVTILILRALGKISPGNAVDWQDMLEILKAAVLLVLGFYFGSSRSSRQKDETIAAIAKG